MGAIPQFGVDYDVGWIGFTFHEDDFSSWAIKWGERWNRGKFPAVTHVFVCSGPGECIEAHLETGVAQASLSKYFSDPSCKIYFRQPAAWTKEIGWQIVSAARSKIGCGYGTSLLFADALNDSFFGHWVGKLSRGWSTRLLASLFDRDGEFICSELAASALDSIPIYHGCGILNSPLDTIDPQEFFGDGTVLVPWS